jgi:hypothetical protein
MMVNSCDVSNNNIEFYFSIVFIYMLRRQLNCRFRKQNIYEEIRTKSKTKERKLTSVQNLGYKEKK